MTATTAIAAPVKTASLPTGVTLQYTEQGNPDGTPVVFLHGLSDSLLSFQPVMPLLPSSLRAIALSQRGHGDSSRPASGYAMSDFAADVNALLDALGIDRAFVVGHSMGTLVAMRVATDYPERVLGLALLGAFYPNLSGRADLAELRDVVESLTDPVDPEFVREFQYSTLTLPVAAEFMDAVVSESLKLPARVWQQALAGVIDEDLSAALGAIAAPTLVIWGAHDVYATRDDQDNLLAAIPNAHLRAYPDAGHALQWEAPARVAEDITTFASNLRP